MDIPGYKWDESRKRYFKIMKTGQLPNSKYTISALAQDHRNKDRQAIKGRSRMFAPGNADPAAIFDARTVARKPKSIYSGGPEEIITSFHYFTDKNELVTGSRDGVFSYSGFRSGPGLSVIDIKPMGDGIVAAAVDHTRGSVLATPAASIGIPHEFVTSMLVRDQRVVVGSQRGCTIWDPALKTTDTHKLQSVSALCEYDSHLLAGSKNGSLQLVDLRGKSGLTTKLPNAVTNVGQAKSTLICATSLEDNMLLYDTRQFNYPVMQYTEYENWSTFTHGFALNESRSAVCVAMENGICKCYDIKSGRVLTTLGSKSKYVVPHIQWIRTHLIVAHANKVKAMPGKLRLARSDQAALKGVSNVYNSIQFTYR